MYLFPPQIDHFIKDNTSPVQTKVSFPIFAMFFDHEAPLAVTSLPWQPFKTVPRNNSQRSQVYVGYYPKKNMTQNRSKITRSSRAVIGRKK